MPSPIRYDDGHYYSDNPYSPSADFDFEQFDTMEATIKDALAAGRDIGPIVNAIIQREALEQAAQMLGHVLCLIADSRKPKLTVDHIAYAVGSPITEGKSAAQLARKHGVHKQSFSRGAIKIVEMLGLRPSRAMRSQRARSSMARAFREKHG